MEIYALNLSMESLLFQDEASQKTMVAMLGIFT